LDSADHHWKQNFLPLNLWSQKINKGRFFGRHGFVLVVAVDVR
jgi:hypothetical protein